MLGFFAGCIVDGVRSVCKALSDGNCMVNGRTKGKAAFTGIGVLCISCRKVPVSAIVATNVPSIRSLFWITYLTKHRCLNLKNLALSSLFQIFPKSLKWPDLAGIGLTSKIDKEVENCQPSIPF
ncbi:hypothetical protein KC331_g21 [Hortaea werneckii]|nr:hypothetical protein KC331_g21 [Hortaea werneckii]